MFVIRDFFVWPCAAASLRSCFSSPNLGYDRSLCLFPLFVSLGSSRFFPVFVSVGAPVFSGCGSSDVLELEF